ncbi:pyruvate dehydrogenase E2 component (dihydrolipoamide acetyltransferase) [Salinibacterium amurskyense]|uniref:Dihydrolipoamide acetyltransferase component of pyruvate dehydrogenase complex n=1 Tax=Salinibacterium amurskyense TaxID=205941 RepID=A0A2M9D6H1_9MICO|nr:dihydrolipoamide acetyltransferase family protein [Salinibacterium amurskyense]PJJ81304.1 pyruvate dehydrogenase E2 component (dihydrolipoamide acetyltransferase) [Salinibacterium amurskyense]RLQ83313.1 2-oxo acid dehydrogenase subunit E2 [Salinibacterium amurskyense]GHD80963.1 acetyltransferase component of pyruvate dehydrogenase complex [Salinibacterium amurskyense]
MASIFRMPGISADAEEATLLEWSIVAGATVKQGDVLATVETEKANVDIEADSDGVVMQLMAEAGDSVTIGAPIAILLDQGEDGSDPAAILSGLGLAPAVAAAAEPAAPAGAVDAAPAGAPASTPAPASSGATEDAVAHGTRLFASPLARRLALENGVELSALSGSGPGGRIVRADVERLIADGPATASAAPVPAAVQAAPPAAAAPAATKPPQPAAAGDVEVPHTAMRRAIASALSASKQTVPHFYLTSTLRVDALLDLRERINTSSPVRVSINDFFVKATALTLRAVPEMNVNWTPTAVRHLGSVDVAVAIQGERGLFTPLIRDADAKSLTEISTSVRDLAQRANDGTLKQHELVGGSFAVSNLGKYGVESFSAILNPPQVGIVAVAGVVRAPIVEGDEIVIGNTVTVTVSVDHRPVDGVLAAQWLARFKEYIENPLSMLV